MHLCVYMFSTERPEWVGDGRKQIHWEERWQVPERSKAAGQGALVEEPLFGEGKISAFSKVGGLGPRYEKLCGGLGRASQSSLESEHSDVVPKQGFRSGSVPRGVEMM